MRTILIGTVTSLILAAGGAAAADLSSSSAATNWDGRTAPPLAGSSTTTTTTTTTIYSPGTAVLPPAGYTPNSPSDHRLPDQGESGVSPRASQMATGSHCPPGTPDCGGDNR
ncbi:hypothetical protein [Azospirillum sp. sgz301742]